MIKPSYLMQCVKVSYLLKVCFEKKVEPLRFLPKAPMPFDLLEELLCRISKLDLTQNIRHELICCDDPDSRETRKTH